MEDSIFDPVCKICGDPLTTDELVCDDCRCCQKKPAVEDLGWANGWSKTPNIVKQCRNSKHKPIKQTIRMFEHEVRCDICGYVYRYDSS